MEWIICPAPGCGKKIKSLRAHYRASHPDLDIPDLRTLVPDPGTAQPQEKLQEPLAQVTPQETLSQEPPVESSPPEAPQSNVLQKLKAFGIDPNDIMLAFSPLIEKSVVQTLEKMQLGEAINKKMVDVEVKLGEKIQPLIEMGQQLQAGPGGQLAGNGQPAQGNNTLMNQMLPLLMQKFLNPNGGSVNLESMVKTLETARSLSDIFSKPYIEGQVAARREMNETIKLMSSLGATQEEKRKRLGEKAE